MWRILILVTFSLGVLRSGVAPYPRTRFASPEF
jgi:hypothetical protein